MKSFPYWHISLLFCFSDVFSLETLSLESAVGSALSLLLNTLCMCAHWAHLLQSCLTLCSLVDCSPPGSSVHAILQAKILEWVTPSPGDLPDPGIEPGSPALEAGALISEPPGKPKTINYKSTILQYKKKFSSNSRFPWKTLFISFGNSLLSLISITLWLSW